MSTEANERGISFRDVAAYLKELTGRYGGYFSFTISFDVSREAGLRLSIVLERRDHVVLSMCNNHPKKQWEYWPNTKSSTFAGLMFRMCYELDERLGTDDRVAQAKMPF